MPLEVQASLLRVLQEKEIQRVGGTETLRVDVRVIAATNRDLLATVAEGRFRERQHILSALTRSNWKIAGPGGAAALLGLHANTLRSRMQRHAIAWRETRPMPPR